MITFPIPFPAKAPCRVDFYMVDAVGRQASPVTLEETTYDWGGDGWEIDIEMPPLKGATDIAEAVVSFLIKLRGSLGSFTMGPPGYTGPRGTWVGTSPLLSGAHAAGARSLLIRNASPFTRAKDGDWLQLTGALGATRPYLHRVLQDCIFDSNGTGTLEVWPRTREAFADGAALTLASPLGRWALANNRRTWSIEEAKIYGLRFSAREARDA